MSSEPDPHALGSHIGQPDRTPVRDETLPAVHDDHRRTRRPVEDFQPRAAIAVPPTHRFWLRQAEPRCARLRREPRRDHSVRSRRCRCVGNCGLSVRGRTIRGQHDSDGAESCGCVKARNRPGIGGLQQRLLSRLRAESGCIAAKGRERPGDDRRGKARAIHQPRRAVPTCLKHVASRGPDIHGGVSGAEVTKKAAA